ncbi:putative ankyrin repeat protein L25 [Tupanvirus soda lake]|uniref:Ankyrin repeat protein L25 n=2 Tax=Tupanvirus TaxID=2094720 RepID=A0AC62AC68_9VIRU|nr:putative ankyrin repeat protein L25 [Tupanvirus soda lake]QKU35356.1 putative ankyrin repeat protein L25 [Tupanvirus soda lake]
MMCIDHISMISELNIIVMGKFDKFDILMQTEPSKAYAYFLELCQSDSCVEEIRYMVDSGINPRQNNDEPLVKSCYGYNVDIVKYFINECGADVNAYDSIGLFNSVDNNTHTITKFLLENGVIVTDKIIYYAIRWFKSESIELFLQYGVDPYRITNILWEYLNDQRPHMFKIMQHLNKNNVDFNQSLDLFTKK